ncbi:hypothetical protein RSOLAG1IB_08565 [Rhizoctonia solani AG-1 IB]|uniref:Uncharacterized protein n=1 Tax=Thanatephorus cucumeris (strain AG1-IB / isolate 7/3/14) TaxID=1108050 RepID=A0A0B7FLC5_THACB|nr:hypothetical protein RSOLAG1IB_08565 [Rhizoctonia solani AG-1 IB]
MLCVRSINLFFFPTHHPCTANNTNASFMRPWKESRLEVWFIAYIELCHSDAHNIPRLNHLYSYKHFIFHP